MHRLLALCSPRAPAFGDAKLSCATASTPAARSSGWATSPRSSRTTTALRERTGRDAAACPTPAAGTQQFLRLRRDSRPARRQRRRRSRRCASAAPTSCRHRRTGRGAETPTAAHADSPVDRRPQQDDQLAAEQLAAAVTHYLQAANGPRPVERESRRRREARRRCRQARRQRRRQRRRGAVDGPAAVHASLGAANRAADARLRQGRAARNGRRSPCEPIERGDFVRAHRRRAAALTRRRARRKSAIVARSRRRQGSRARHPSRRRWC